MDRDTVLKHSRTLRLEHKILPDFIELLEELCEIKGHPECYTLLTQALLIPGLRNEIVYPVLDYFEREYHIILIEKINNNNLNSLNKQLINII